MNRTYLAVLSGPEIEVIQTALNRYEHALTQGVVPGRDVTRVVETQTLVEARAVLAEATR